MTDLAKRLRIKAGMIEMGERIAWGSDSALMREAADALERVAASAVQGEPVAVMYEDGSLLSKADCGDNFEICCKVQTPLYTAPQPAPDVDVLVEALDWLRGAINCTPESDKHQSGAWISTKHPRIKQIDELLAAHRKGGE